MRRLILLAVAASVLAACGSAGGGSTAAMVNDTELSVRDVESVPYESSGSMGTSEFAQYLTALIQWQILDSAAAADFDIDPSEDEVEAELDELLNIQAGGATLEELAQSQNLSETTMRRVMRVQMIQEAVADRLGEDLAGPSDEEVSDALDEQRAGMTEVCVRHVLVETAEEAEDVKSRLDEGEAFEDVATDVSTDPSAAQNSGDLGCGPAGTYVEEFRDASLDAEIDAISEPVESQFGFHVLQVYDRTEAGDDGANEEMVRDQLAQGAEVAALEEWLLEKLDEADVRVNEEFGEWVTDPQPMVAPPGSQSEATTPTSTVD